MNDQQPDQLATIPLRIERRAGWHTPADCENLLDVEERLNRGSDRMKRIEENQNRMEAKLDANSTSTEAAAASVAELVDIMRLGKSFFKVIGYFGALVKWAAAIAAPVVAIWVTIKFGSKP